MSMSLRVADAPVARADDPITSYQAGENQAAREASEQAVLDILIASAYHHHAPMSAHEIVVTAQLAGYPWTEQRLRTAIAQLGRKGIIQHAGRREAASPTGRSAMTWALVQR